MLHITNVEPDESYLNRIIQDYNRTNDVGINLEIIINYFCDRLKNNHIDPSCLSSQYLIFGTKIIKEWANAPEIAKKIMKFIDFDIKSPIRKGLDEKYN